MRTGAAHFHSDDKCIFLFGHIFELLTRVFIPRRFLSLRR